MGKGRLDITFLVPEEAYIYHEFGENGGGRGVGISLFVIQLMQLLSVAKHIIPYQVKLSCSCSCSCSCPYFYYPAFPFSSDFHFLILTSHIHSHSSYVDYLIFNINIIIFIKKRVVG